jgi:2'-5' RNA ligase
MFIGIEVPREWQEKFTKYKHAFPRVQGLRWTHPKDQHLTLFFLGMVRADKVDAIRASLRKIADHYEVFSLRMDRFRQAPTQGGPSAVWAQFQDDGHFDLLSRKIKRAVMEITALEEEVKGSLPHVTLARMKQMPVMENIDVSVKDRELPVTLFHLYEVKNGKDQSYQIVETFKLKAHD